MVDLVLIITESVIRTCTVVSLYGNASDCLWRLSPVCLNQSARPTCIENNGFLKLFPDPVNPYGAVYEEEDPYMVLPSGRTRACFNVQ